MPKKTLRSRIQKILRQIQFAFIKFGFSNYRNIFIQYQPDSKVHFDQHSEFEQLSQKFTAENQKNNGGDISRLWSLMLNLKQLEEQGVQGDFAELGVWRGNTAAVLAHYAKQQGRQVFLFDTFEGFNANDLKGVDQKHVEGAFQNTSVELVRSIVGHVDCSHIVQGYFPESLQPEHAERTYSAVSLDCDLYEPMKAGLAFFYPRMPKGGIFFLHDYSSHYWPGSKQAIDEFCAEHGVYIVLMPDKSGSAFFRKQ
ncbi:TylF/MycF family methyltransferase [Limnobacter parvus]|uniref:TylF/MycF family methyltransferase n=1 Tax=Limnobacter parvus TaxID=2939690 RepID=A0ABT1XHN9_9BURK|nr:TylF/MycF family methyltransferase [Limnobacter parvus]MCR2745787.1 TylF/MycF family methyltransferase [Limnobacter parvus]